MVRELPLLRNNTASEIVLHKSGAVQSVDWIFIIMVTAWRICDIEQIVLKIFLRNRK